MRAIRIYVPSILIGLLLAAGVRWKRLADLEAAQASYRLDSEHRTKLVAQAVEATLNQIYAGLRTIARLPGVRDIERHAEQREFRGGGHGFDEDAKLAVQELYNNLASSVAMSEVYIVPHDLEPDQINAVTGQPDEPMVTFDELIVGRTAADTGGDEHHSDEEVEEIEIHEYRLMKKQLAWMKAHVPTRDDIEGLDFPVLGGPEVVTCDNTRYSPSAPDDRDRSGLVYSVPFYARDGALKGCVSGVILSHALRDLLPSGDFVLVNRIHQYVIDGAGKDARLVYATAMRGEPDPTPIYSQVTALKTRDADSEWLLWASQPDSMFWNRSDVQSSRFAMVAGYGSAMVLSCGLVVIGVLVRRNRQILESRNAELAVRVEERTHELSAANVQLREEITQREALQQKLMDASRQAGKAEVASSVLHNVGNVLNSVNTSATEIAQRVQGSRVRDLGDVARLVNEHADDLPAFVQHDERGRLLPKFLTQFSEHLVKEQADVLQEINDLASKIDHIKQIVRLQQTMAKSTSVIETIAPAELVGQALQLSAVAFERHGIQVERAVEAVPEISTDRHQVLQILVNLLRNAKEALMDCPTGQKRIRVAISATASGRVRISVTDNGIGIAQENLARLFRHGFTTRSAGHGFGLHSAALSAAQLGGALTAASDGSGTGATFTLELPVETRNRAAA